MIHFTTSIDINRPTDEIFDFLVEFEHLPKWNYFVRHVDKITPGPIRVGTRFHQVRETDEQDYEITLLEPHRVIAMTTSPQSRPALTMRFDLEPRPEGTRVMDTWTLQTDRGPVMERLATRRVRAAVDHNLAALQRLLEDGATLLPDGRPSALA
jgi:carbon monoxide dehydrogenase subunit G